MEVSWRVLFLLVLGMGCAFLLWHSLGLPLIILDDKMKNIIIKEDMLSFVFAYQPLSWKIFLLLRKELRKS